MSFLGERAGRLLQALEFANIDRLDELKSLLEQRAAASAAQARRGDIKDPVQPRDFGDPRVIDFFAFSRRTAFRSSGRGG